MSEYCFGVGRGKLSVSLVKKIDRIANKFGAYFTNPSLPDGARYWFAAPNRGEPFDSRLTKDIYTALEENNIHWPLKLT